MTIASCPKNELPPARWLDIARYTQLSAPLVASPSRAAHPEMASTLLLAALLPLCSALRSRRRRERTGYLLSRAIVNYQVEEGGEARATPLSDDFDGAVQDAANGLLGAIQDGSLKLRLDFDTSMGDETYTKLKLSTEFARDVAIEWALSMEEDENLVLFFPDAGAAALARQEGRWIIWRRRKCLPTLG